MPTQAELSPSVSVQNRQAGFGHQALITPESRCSHALVITQRNVQYPLCQKWIAELTRYQTPCSLINDGDTSLLLLCCWIRSCSASFPICGFLTSPCWCRWCWLQDPSSGSGPRKAGVFWGLSTSAKHCLGDILMIRSSRMGSEFPFSSKLSCFFYVKLVLFI